MNRQSIVPAAAASALCIAIILIATLLSIDATTYIGLYTDEAHAECSWSGALYELPRREGIKLGSDQGLDEITPR